MPALLIILLAVIVVSLNYLGIWIDRKYPSLNKDSENIFESDRIERMFRSRRDYYRNVYLKSEAWKRKRYVVFKRDNWTCVYCGAKATQVHHKRYAKRNIGKEPIEWLVSVCKSCHDKQHDFI